MASIHWARAVSGTFATGADWSGGRVPGVGDDAILDAAGSSAYTVSAPANATVGSIQLAATALLDIQANFSVTGGTGTGAIAGAIRVENGATLTLQGTVTNTGSIELFGTVSTTSLVIGAGGVTLKGGGSIFLNFTGGKFQQIVAAPGGSILTDVDDRISGQGFLGGAGMTIINEAAGFIEAKGGRLVIDTGAHTIVNAGLIDAEGAPSYPLTPGQGVIQSPVENNGFLKADGDGSTMTFNGAVTGSGRAIISGGLLRFNAGFSQSVDFERSSGVLYLAQSVNYTSYIAQFTTTGGESLDLGDIAFGGSTKASYSGTTTSGTLTITDGTHTARIRLEGNYLAVAFSAASDGHGGTTITDGPKARHWLNPVNGLFQTPADWTGGLAPGSGNDAILDAPGATRYTVTASTSQTVTGIQTAASAILSITGPFTATNGTDGGANAGRIAIANGGAFTVGGTLANTGLITLAASSGRASLVVAGAVTLTGGGEIFLGDNANNIIVGTSPSAVLDNIQNTIAGAGHLGNGALTLINEAAGKIESEEPSTRLVIDTGANTIVNAGLIEATRAGVTILSPVNNSGILKAEGANLTVAGAVTGSGRAIVAGGLLRFNAAFNQNVAFAGPSGTLYLARSAAYASLISGFSTTGAESLDLHDIVFGRSTRASYSGTTTSGVLTVTDGTYTARIRLQGNYTAVAFTAASDGHGGTIVTDGPKAPIAATAIHGFVAAMAGHGPGAGGLILSAVRREERPSLGLAAHPFA